MHGNMRQSRSVGVVCTGRRGKFMVRMMASARYVHSMYTAWAWCPRLTTREGEPSAALPPMPPGPVVDAVVTVAVAMVLAPVAQAAGGSVATAGSSGLERPCRAHLAPSAW